MAEITSALCYRRGLSRKVRSHVQLDHSKTLLLQAGLLDADPSHASAAPGEHDMSTSPTVSKHSCQPHHCCAMAGEKLLGEEGMELQVLG